MNKKRYVLVTSAFNEEKSIEKTILSVISQTILPVAWLVISDGSTDGTDNILKLYAQKKNFIYFYRLSSEKVHSFANKVKALNFGIEKLKRFRYDFIGILDADMGLANSYYEKILTKFNQDDKLGITGGNVVELIHGKKKKRIKSMNSVAGAVQMFRKECFESLNGFLPLEYGGEDAALEITARMKGWTVMTIRDVEAVHFGYVGSGTGGQLKARFRRGIMFYYLGYHPLFHLVRCLYRIIERPLLFGALLEIAGYVYSFVKYKHRLPQEAVSFLRSEQISRLKQLFRFLGK